MKSLRGFFRGQISELFGIDERALRAFRFVLGLCVFFNVIGRLLVLPDFGSDFSFYPRFLALDYVPAATFSVHFGSGGGFFQAIFLLVEAVAGLCVAFNYRPRAAAAIACFFLISWLNRYGLLRYGSDHILQFFLFWSIFLPRTEERGKRWVVSFATACILVQLLIVYFAAALLKNGANWRVSWDALYFTLSIDEYASASGVWLLNYPAFLRVLTGLSFYLELVGPLALLLPWMQRYMRASVPFLFIAFHLGTAVLMNLEIFPWASIACWLLFLPPRFWDLVGRLWHWAGGDRWIERADKALAAMRNVGRIARTRLVYGWESVGVHVALAFFFATVLYWNAFSVGYRSAWIESVVTWPSQVLDLRQGWRMFSPNGTATDLWWSFQGTRKNGQKVEVETGSENLSFAKPPRSYFEGRNMRRKRFMDAVWRPMPPGSLSAGMERRKNRARNRYLAVLCSRWNENEPVLDRKIEKIEVYVTEESVDAVDEPSRKETRFLLERKCALPAVPNSSTEKD